MVCKSGEKECKLVKDPGYYMDGNESNKKLIYCSASGAGGASTGCNLVPNSLLGYFKMGDNPDKYIKCTNSGCTDDSIITTSSCTSGKLIKVGNAIKLCIDSDVKKALTVFTLDTKYLVQAKILNTEITDDNKYYLVKVDGESAQKVKTSDENYGHYLYEYEGKAVADHDSCPIDDEGNALYSNMVEYERDEEGDTYTKEASN